MSFKSGYISLIGLPNVGKSTLMNQLLKERLSIVTNKPQTTRKRVLGILTSVESQMIFLDTPGILTPNYLMQEKLLDFVSLSVKDADILLILVDVSIDLTGSKTLENATLIEILNNPRKKKILVINKIDLSNEEVVTTLVKKAEDTKFFDAIIPASSLISYNIEKIEETLVQFLPEGPKYYPDDQLTSEPERFFVAELIREKIFENYKDEIPYSTEVIIEEFKERENRKDFISASIIVERESQKPIIIGKGGEGIKKIGQSARTAIEAFLMRPVYLEIHVKVKKNWRSDPVSLKNFGYDLSSN
ncbi:MAG: GTPase Era [Bacteroidetes bacterium]|nr:GTPase Era [Bacteroidota bacterium]MBU1678093.1 GTPase Era [Bacteroidota bacterium]MBU2507105.1 GTPase Era [Bacteroidota bacterium]